MDSLRGKGTPFGAYKVTGFPNWYATHHIGLSTAVHLLPNRINRYPTWADGILIMDSGAFIKGPLSWHQYVAILLSRIFHSTGRYCIAVCLGGLTFAGPNKARTYGCLLDGIMAPYPLPPRFMVWVSFGNDIYPPQEDMRGYGACD